MVIESTFEKRYLDIAAPEELSFTSAGISIMLIFTNNPGNILIVLVLVFDPNKNLRTPFNWLLANLTIAELIVGIHSSYRRIFSHQRRTQKACYSGRMGDQPSDYFYLMHSLGSWPHKFGS